MKCMITRDIIHAIGDTLEFRDEDELATYLIERYIEFIEEEEE